MLLSIPTKYYVNKSKHITPNEIEILLFSKVISRLQQGFKPWHEFWHNVWLFIFLLLVVNHIIMIIHWSYWVMVHQSYWIIYNIDTIFIWWFWQIRSYKKIYYYYVRSSICQHNEKVLLLLWFHISIEIECAFVLGISVIILKVFFLSSAYKRLLSLNIPVFQMFCLVLIAVFNHTWIVVLHRIR